VAHRLSDLQPAEVADLMLLAQCVAASLERHYGAAAVTLAIQDGEAAGQTVGGWMDVSGAARLHLSAAAQLQRRLQL